MWSFFSSRSQHTSSKRDWSSDVCSSDLTYVPFIKAAGELKTKPTQQSIAKLREIGITPHIIVCRCEKPLDKEIGRASCRERVNGWVGSGFAQLLCAVLL